MANGANVTPDLCRYYRRRQQHRPGPGVGGNGTAQRQWRQRLPQRHRQHLQQAGRHQPGDQRGAATGGNGNGTGNGGNATVNVNGNIIQTNKNLTKIEIDAFATAG